MFAAAFVAFDGIAPVTNPATPVEVSVTYVNFADAVAVDTATIDPADITAVKAGSGALVVTNATWSIATDTAGRAKVAAKYSIAPADGTWDAADEGAYTISLNAGQVRSESGDAVRARPLGWSQIVLPDGDTSIVVPEIPIGDFGRIDGKRVNLRHLDGDGTTITISLNTGTGHAYTTADGLIHLVLEGTASRSKLVIKATGGDKQAALGNIRSNAGLRAISAKGGSVSGTISINGDLGNATLGSLSGTLAAAGGIGSLDVRGDAAGATVLAGCDLGDDGRFGGEGVGADEYKSGAIGAVSVQGSGAGATFVAGPVSPAVVAVFPRRPVPRPRPDKGIGILIAGSASIAAAVAEADGVFIAGTGFVASFAPPIFRIQIPGKPEVVPLDPGELRSVSVKGGVDETTQFVAKDFGTAKIPQKVSPPDDPLHFVSV